MNIVFVLSEVPYPPSNGVRLVPFNIVRLMREAGHSCSIAVLTDSQGGSESDLKNFAVQYGVESTFHMLLPERARLDIVLKALSSNNMYFMERYRCNEFRHALADFVRRVEPDAIHFDIITMCQYRDIAESRARTVASINDSYTLALDNAFRNRRYKGLGFLYRKFQHWQSKKYEAVQYSNFDAVHVMSDVDKRYLHALGCETLIHAIPNGVDDSIFSSDGWLQGAGDVVFVANLAGENLIVLAELLRTVWMKVHVMSPSRKFRIVGRVGLAARDLYNQNHNRNGVFFEGFVENLNDVYRQCCIALVPIDKTCGLVNKAVEAMAAGLAVIGFKNTFLGISGASEGMHYFAADNIQGFFDIIQNLDAHPELLCTVRRSAMAFARENFRWDSRVVDFERMYGGLERVQTGVGVHP